MWGVAGLWHDRRADGVTIPLASLLLLNIVVATLFTRRSAPTRVANVIEQLLVLPSVAVGPFVLFRSPSFSIWGWLPSIAFCVGAVFASWSLFALGRSFSIFPAIRQLRSWGTYAWMRHPVYAGELLMVVAAAATRFDGWSILLVIVGVVTTGARVLIEESVLRTGSEYDEYCARVRWRLLPGVW